MSNLLVPAKMFRSRGSKYTPHQGASECRRRLRQIEEGKLRGPEEFISTEVRYRAAGLYEGSVRGTIVDQHGRR